jgi:hypothetical protein
MSEEAELFRPLQEDDSMSFRTLASGLVLLAALTLTAGCSGQKTTPGADAQDKAGKDKPAKDKDEHTHGAGPHGGAVGDWGGGQYHIEFKPDHDKKEATVWILGSDEKTPTPIKAKDGQLLLSIKGLKTKDSFEMVLKAEPDKGDPAGTSSRFVGKHEKLGVEQEFEGEVTGEVEGTPYAGKFKEEPVKDKK